MTDCDVFREQLRPTWLDQGCFPLHRYAEIMGHDPFAFFGIDDNQYNLMACDSIWTCSQRLRLQTALIQAVDMMSDELGYTLCRQFQEDYLPSNGHLYTKRLERMKLSWGYVQSIGMPATSDVSLAETVTYGGRREDATVTIAAGTYDDGDLSELCFFEVDTDRRVWPSVISRATGGAITVTIPKARLVKQANECDDTILIDDTDKFIEEVDVKRCYLDTTTGIQIIRDPQPCDLCSTVCQGTYTTGCATIENERRSVIRVQPATYDADAGAWTGATLSKMPTRVYVPYWAGYQEGASPYRWNYQCSDGRVWTSAELPVIWLALSLLPSPPCGCQPVRDYYTENMKPAPVISRTAEAPPWGMTAGAWKAWQFVQRKALGRGGML